MADHVAHEDIGCPVQADFKLDLTETRAPLEVIREHDELRELAPVVWSPEGGGYYIFTEHDAVLEAFQKPEVFSSHGISPTQPNPELELIPIMQDPPVHTKWRRVLGSYFTPNRAQQMTGRIREVARGLIDDIAAHGECEMISQFCNPLPAIIFCDLMGLPSEEMAQLLRWEEQVMHHGYSEDDPTGSYRLQGQIEVMQYLWQLVSERRTNPDPTKNDIISQASQWRVDGEAPTDQELLLCCATLFMAGLDTVASMLSYFFYHLATHEQERKRIADDPAIIPNAVEELLRAYPIARVGREVRADYELAGCPLKPGDKVLLPTIAGNRDGTEGGDAGEVRLDREAPRHLTFGAGPHRCIGAHLARVELAVALEEWHRAIPEYHISDMSSVRERAGQICGLAALPLAW